MKESEDIKVVFLHLDTLFQTTVKIIEQKTVDGKSYCVEISCMHSDGEVAIPCPTKRSAEIVCHWFIRGLAHA